MKRKRKVYGAALPAKKREHKGETTRPMVCLICGQTIAADLIAVAIAEGSIYVHGCGRVLYNPAAFVSI